MAGRWATCSQSESGGLKLTPHSLPSRHPAEHLQRPGAINSPSDPPLISLTPAIQRLGLGCSPSWRFGLGPGASPRHPILSPRVPQVLQCSARCDWCTCAPGLALGARGLHDAVCLLAPLCRCEAGPASASAHAVLWRSPSLICVPNAQRRRRTSRKNGRRACASSLSHSR